MDHRENGPNEEHGSKPIKKLAAFMAAMMSSSLVVGCSESLDAVLARTTIDPSFNLQRPSAI